MYYNMNEVDLILEDTFYETHTVDGRHKSIRLMVCHNIKEMSSKLAKIPMVGGK